jgi:hypothetical protein
MTVDTNRNIPSLLTTAKAIDANIPSSDIVEETGDSGAVQGANASASEEVTASHKTVISLAARSVALVDNAGVGAHLSSKVYSFPQGVILIEGAVANLTIGKSSAGVNADWDGDIGLGSVACDNSNTLSSTEQNIIPTTATPQAVSGNTTSKAKSTGTLVIDNTAGGAGNVYLNQLVDDADQDVTTTPCNLTYSGTITLIWKNIGDN